MQCSNCSQEPTLPDVCLPEAMATALIVRGVITRDQALALVTQDELQDAVWNIIGPALDQLEALAPKVPVDYLRLAQQRGDAAGRAEPVRIVPAGYWYAVALSALTDVPERERDDLIDAFTAAAEQRHQYRLNVTVDEYWECSCPGSPKDYVHPKTERTCRTCNLVPDEAADARLIDVLIYRGEA